MTDQDAVIADQNAQNAAGPPPAAEALNRSGLVDQPRGAVRKILDQITHFVTGSNAHGKQS
jgi:hypothetical protein